MWRKMGRPAQEERKVSRYGLRPRADEDLTYRLQGVEGGASVYRIDTPRASKRARVHGFTSRPAVSMTTRSDVHASYSRRRAKPRTNSPHVSDLNSSLTSGICAFDQVLAGTLEYVSVVARMM